MASTNAASLAVKQGYKKVYAFRDGLPGWITAGHETVTVEKLPKTKIESISAADLKEMIDKKEDIVLLDIRFASLVKKYSIKDKHYQNIPLDMLPDRYDEIQRGKKVVVIGETGKRAAVAVRFLSSKGFKKVLSAEGGMQKWVRDGYPVKTK